MTPAAPGGLGQSAADCKGVVSAGLHILYCSRCFVTVPQSCIDHPLAIYKISGAPMKCQENFDMGEKKGSYLRWVDTDCLERIRDICSKMLLHNCIATQQGSGLYSVNRLGLLQFTAISCMQCSRTGDFGEDSHPPKCVMVKPLVKDIWINRNCVCMGGGESYSLPSGVFLTTSSCFSCVVQRAAAVELSPLPPYESPSSNYGFGLH